MITVKVGTWIGAALRTPGAAVETEAGLGLYCRRSSRLLANSFKAYRLWESLD